MEQKAVFSTQILLVLGCTSYSVNRRGDDGTRLPSTLGVEQIDSDVAGLVYAVEFNEMITVYECSGRQVASVPEFL